MTLSTIPKERTIEALEAVWSSLARLLGDLARDDWKRQSPLPGWDVQAVVAHVIGTESVLLGIPTPDVEIDHAQSPHVRNEFGALNEKWVVAFAQDDPADVSKMLEERTGRRLEALRTMTADDWDAESFTPAGRDSYGRFMQIRVFDCWLHEQDVRDAVDRPGHESGVAVEVTLDEITNAIGYVVGKKAGVPAGTRVTFDLTGASGRQIHLAATDRARVVAALEQPATVRLTMPVGVFTRLCGGRVTPADVISQVVLAGDERLGGQIVENMAYTI